jgi:hypothetical protein
MISMLYETFSTAIASPDLRQGGFRGYRVPFHQALHSNLQGCNDAEMQGIRPTP